MVIRSQNFNITFFSDNQRPGLYVCTHLLPRQEFWKSLMRWAPNGAKNLKGGLRR